MTLPFTGVILWAMNEINTKTKQVQTYFFGQFFIVCKLTKVLVIFCVYKRFKATSFRCKVGNTILATIYAHSSDFLRILSVSSFLLKYYHTTGFFRKTHQLQILSQEPSNGVMSTHGSVLSPGKGCLRRFKLYSSSTLYFQEASQVV